MIIRGRIVKAAFCICFLLAGAAPLQAKEGGKKFLFFPLGESIGPSRLTSEYIPYQSEGVLPDRPRLLLELGDPFLKTGNLFPGFSLPGGAVWQPRLWIFSIFRGVFQTFDPQVTPRNSELATRLDLFGNLQLTGTERVMIGIRPLENPRTGEFYGIRYPEGNEEVESSYSDAEITTLFFEGDFGSLFPNLDFLGVRRLDYGFSVGRQNLLLQEGALINDDIDMVALVRNSINIPGGSNLRVTAAYSWYGSDRGPVDLSQQADLFGLFTSWDYPVSTLNFDSLYVKDDLENGGDGAYAGLSAIQRLGSINSTFRAAGSHAVDEEDVELRNVSVDDGVLVAADFAKTLHGVNDFVYFNPFISFGTYTIAGQQPGVSGALSPTGLAFTGFGIGSQASPLPTNPRGNVTGGALGYQAFWNQRRTNMTLEAAGLIDREQSGSGITAGFIRIQQKINRFIQLTLDGYIVSPENEKARFGGRSEIQIIL